jgi:hypothetical protein
MIPPHLALSGEQRAAVEVRVEQLGDAEVACDIDYTMAVVVEMLDAFPAAKVSDDQTKRKAKGYITALEDAPTWAVAEACRRWLKARAGPQNYDFAPTPPRLRQVVDDALADLRGQRIALRRLLKAEPEVVIERSAELSERVNRQFAELLGHLKSRARRVA